MSRSRRLDSPALSTRLPLPSLFPVGAAFALALAPAPAAAQIEGPEESEEMIITAQRVERTLQQTAISMTAFSGEGLEARGIENAVDLTEFVPNVNVQLNANGTGFFVASRGIAQADATLITRDPATAVYLDGVYWGMTSGNLIDVLDIERIEVLRGPQGDLYGRNSSAGAINFITRKPSGSYGTRASAKYGRFDTAEFRAYQEFPVFGGEGLAVDESAGALSASLSFAGLKRDATYKNTAGGPDIDERGRIATRGALRYDNGPFEGLFSFDYSYASEQGPEMELTQTYGSSGLKALLDPFLRSGRDNDISVRGSQGAIVQTGPGFSFAPAPGLQQDQSEVVGTSLTLGYQLADLPGLGDATLKSVTGYRELWDDTFQDRDGTSIDVFSNFLLTRQWQFSEELNLVGGTDLGPGTLDYVLGYFYFNEDGEQDAAQFAFSDPLLFSAPGSRQFPEIKNHAHAIFTHLAFTPEFLERRLRFEFGIRQTWESKSVSNTQFNLNPATPSYATTGFDKSFAELTPSGQISFQVIPELNVYGTIGKGYLSGGFNGRALYPTVAAAAAAMPAAPPFAALETPYDEETVVNYEAGFKLRAFDRRVRFNAAGFFMDYKDLQRTQLLQAGTTTFSGVSNAGEAEIWGTELELEAVPVERLVLSATYGMALAEYTEYVDFDLVTPAPLDTRDFADERKFSNTPRYNYTLGGAYELPPCRFGTFGARVDWYWQSRTLLQNGDNPAAGQKAYGLLQARVVLRDLPLGEQLGDISLALWGRNLLDREYKPFGIDFNPNSLGALPYTVQYYGERRTVGLELVWRYGALL